MSQASLTSLPLELIHLIASHLNQHSLSHCSLVSHAWHSIFESSLWRSFELHSQFLFHYNNYLSSLKGLFRNIHYLRHVTTSDPTLLCLLTCPRNRPILANLQSLDLFLCNIETTRNNPAVLITLLKGCINLESLSLAGRSCFKHEEDEEADVLQEILAACSVGSLRLLKLDIKVEDYGPCCERCSLSPMIDHDEYQLAVEIERRLPPFVALRELVLLSADIHINPAKLALLARCPNLKRLELESPDECAVRYLTDAILTFCPNLVELVWGGEHKYADELVEGLLRSSRLGWRVLRLPYMNDFGASSYNVVMENAKTLEELHVHKWGDVTEEILHDWFLDFVCSAENLRRLTGHQHGERRARDTAVEVHAYDAFMKYLDEDGGNCKWALGPKMESLQMQIVGIPRPDVVCREDGTPFRDEVFGKESGDGRRYETQRYIYEQLAKMTGLQELVLGLIVIDRDDLTRYRINDSVYSKMTSLTDLEDNLKCAWRMITLFNYQCLEFSLESGLELLEEMKELRVLDVTSTAHRIGVPELEWMRVHWPRLKEIRGLASERRWAGEGEDGMAVHAAVEEWMAVHPNGIGSSYAEADYGLRRRRRKSSVHYRRRRAMPVPSQPFR